MLKLEFSSQNAGIVSIAYVVYVFLRAIYRITLHPLAKFPGPKLAAISHKYEWYYDGVKVGQYTSEIARMHEQYGAFHSV